jgi:hypothetical protein
MARSSHVLGVDQLNAIRPWSDVEAAGRTEVEQHRPGIAQQGEDPQRAVGGVDNDAVAAVHGRTLPLRRTA